MKRILKYMYILLIGLFVGIFPVTATTKGITLKNSEISLGPGSSITLKYDLAAGLNSSNVVWTSSNEKIAKVDSNGKVSGLTYGTTIITASINGTSSTCEVSVIRGFVATKGISLNKSTTSILVGSSETLINTISPATATNKDVIWSSSNTSVATVDSNGKVTAKKVGTTVITATSSGYSSTCTVTVVSTVGLKSISINKSSLTIKEQASSTLSVSYNPSNATNKKITWKSSNTGVAKVDSNGRVTGVSAGSATITAVSNDGGYVATCKVTVEALSKKVNNVSLDKNELTITAGEETTLKATINPSYAENKKVKWESSDEKIVKVDENGKVTAIKKGTAEIKVITEDGNKEATCKVTVNTPPIKSISFKNEKQTVYINTKTTLVTVADPVTSEIENPIWTSSNEEVATVANGVITSLSIGQTTITVSNQDNTITASIEITVINKPEEKLNISIEGYNLNFDPTIKNYELKIGSEDKLNITTNLSQDKVTINGNQKLKNGSIITITVAGNTKTTYIINIKKNENYVIYFIAIISVLLLFNLIRIILKNRKKDNESKLN